MIAEIGLSLNPKLVMAVIRFAQRSGDAISH
ncbi:AAEL017358-PA, partial [Aedes aegypti]